MLYNESDETNIATFTKEGASRKYLGKCHYWLRCLLHLLNWLSGNKPPSSLTITYNVKLYIICEIQYLLPVSLIEAVPSIRHRNFCFHNSKVKKCCLIIWKFQGIIILFRKILTGHICNWINL